MEPPFLAIGLKDGSGIRWPVVSEDQIGEAVALDNVKAEEDGQRAAGLARGGAHLSLLGEYIHGHKEHLSVTRRYGDMCCVYADNLKWEGR